MARKVLSYCLYGTIPRYTYGLLANIEQLATFYPGWEAWVYHTADVAQFALDHLRCYDTVRLIPTELACATSRMLALAAVDVELLLLRDADSLLSRRDRLAVQEWESSDYLAHAMHDNRAHIRILMGGLTGFRWPSRLDPHMQQRVYDWVAKHGVAWGVDEDFLEQVVYPKVQRSLLIHATGHCDYFRHLSGPVCRRYPYDGPVPGGFLGAQLL
jgi:hypothetical protein